MKRRTPLRRDTPAARRFANKRGSLTRTGAKLKRTRMKVRNAKRAAMRRARDFGDKAAWVRLLPCLVCGRTPSDPHHEPPRSRGGTSEHLTPLCADHHTLRSDSRHALGSNERFREAHGIDLEAAARHIDQTWRERDER
jgi:hypothetical protein